MKRISFVFDFFLVRTTRLACALGNGDATGNVDATEGESRALCGCIYFAQTTRIPGVGQSEGGQGGEGVLFYFFFFCLYYGT